MAQSKRMVTDISGATDLDYPSSGMPGRDKLDWLSHRAHALGGRWRSSVSNITFLGSSAATPDCRSVRKSRQPLVGAWRRHFFDQFNDLAAKGRIRDSEKCFEQSQSFEIHSKVVHEMLAPFVKAIDLKNSETHHRGSCLTHGRLDCAAVNCAVNNEMENASKAVLKRSANDNSPRLK